MHLRLPIWMRGSFEIRRNERWIALVRRDFLSAFERLEVAGGVGDPPAPPAKHARGVPGGRGGARVLPAGDLGEAVLRPFRRGGLPGRLLDRRYFLGNRAFDELILTERLRWSGVPVTEPLAAVQAAHRPGYDALLVTRRVPGALPLSVLLEGSHDPGADRSPASERGARTEPAPVERSAPAERRTPAERIMRQAGRAVRRLHAAGGWHADLNAANLLANPEDPEGGVTILDLDRGRLLPPPLPAPLARRNLRRLRRSLEKLGLQQGLAAWPDFETGYGDAGRATPPGS